MISSIHVVTPLNMPRPTKKMMRRRMKSFCFIMLFSPSNMSDRTSWSAGPAGVGGFSLIVAMKNTAAIAATMPVKTSIDFIPYALSRNGVTIRLARIPK